MKLQIQSIHFDADSKLLDYIQEKCDKLDHFFDKIVDGQVYLKLENVHGVDNKFVEIKVNVPGEQIVAQEQGQKFEEAVDIATESLKRRLIKYKEKMRHV